MVPAAAGEAFERSEDVGILGLLMMSVLFLKVCGDAGLCR